MRAFDHGGVEAFGARTLLQVQRRAGVHAGDFAGVDQGANLALQLVAGVEVVLPEYAGYAGVTQDIGVGPFNFAIV